MKKQEKEKLFEVYLHEKGRCELYRLLENAGIKEYGGENVKEHRREMWYGLCQWAMMFHALGIENEEIEPLDDKAREWAFGSFDAIADKKEKERIHKRTVTGKWIA